MAGTVEGGQLAAESNKAKYGPDFYKRIGAKGGSAPHAVPRTFALDPALARRAGKLGRRSRRIKDIEGASNEQQSAE